MKLLFSKNQISDAVSQLAQKIKLMYGDGDDTVCICVLKGSIMFFADLMKNARLKNCVLDFVSVLSYSGTKSSCSPVLTMPNKGTVSGKRVLLVEDIVDEGHTAKFLYDYFTAQNAKDVKLISLLDKPSARKVDFKPDFFAFSMQKNDFVVGYGLDYNQLYRTLDEIYILEEGEK